MKQLVEDGVDVKGLLATARDGSFVVRGASNDSLRNIGTEYSDTCDFPLPGISFNQNSILPTHPSILYKIERGIDVEDHPSKENILFQDQYAI